jgi:anthranilate/para-aminobenzoate synthase component I
MSPAAFEALAVAKRGEGLTWLDGGGHGALGRFSHLAWGPSTFAVARLGEGDPFAPLRLAPEAFVGAPEVLRSSVAIGYDATWSCPSRLGVRMAPRMQRDPKSIVSWSRTYSAAMVYDHEQQRARFAGVDRAALERAMEESHAASSRPSVAIAVTDVEAPERHRDRILSALEAIARGDLYQVNLARPFLGTYRGEPMALMLAMRAASPVPLGAMLEGPEGITLIARTMERFLSIDPDRRIESRPIKGTIDGRPDAASELLGSGKERAEHAMIVDLVRNDLGRICEAGSVRTPSLFSVEPYARLSHLVSIIEGRLREDVTLDQVLEATFPPASISGAPKLAAIEHIERLEALPRSFYTGALGMIGWDGSLSLAVAIRTAELRAGIGDEGELTYFAGGGIVEASDPDREVEETDLKARALLDAVESLTSD